MENLPEIVTTTSNGNRHKKCRENGGENRLALRSYMLTCLNQHSAAVAE